MPLRPASLFSARYRRGFARFHTNSLYWKEQGVSSKLTFLQRIAKDVLGETVTDLLRRGYNLAEIAELRGKPRRSIRFLTL
jgi:hypothetical protein